MTLRFQLFGRFQVTGNTGSLAHLLRPRSRRLLSFLLLHRSSSVSRERVAFVLWPNNPETKALGNLRRALHELRAVLPTPKGRKWIIASRGELCWNPDTPYWLDVEEFERLVRQATPATLHDAVALYTGDLLPELGDKWVVVERERLRQTQLNALAHLVAHHRALGEHETALDLARRRLALDPLAESPHRDLIALHYLAGDRAAALVAYDRLRTALRDELDVEPMAETQTLLAAITQGAPLPAPSPPPPLLPARREEAVPRLIGRETEMAELGVLWERAAAGAGRLVIVSGQAGIGKSHLVLSLAGYAAKRGGLVLVGHCYEFERAPPYQAIVEMLRSAANLLQHAHLAPAHRAALARLAPDVLGAAGSPEADETASGGKSRTQLFEALLQASLALARSQPVLLLVEDAHWASESTLDWLTYVAPRLAASRLLVVITYRTEEVGAGHALTRLRRRFARKGLVSIFSLGPLSRQANRELVAQMSGLENEVAVLLADCLFVETAGHPFFLQEVVRDLIEAGQIVITGGRWSGPFVEAEPCARAPLPNSLREAINARVERLADVSEAFIRGAAVAGQVFEYKVVQQAGGWTDEMALEALEDLLARDFVCQGEAEEPALSPALSKVEGEAEGTFAFVHHLVQEAIYAELAAPRRNYWHRRIGTAIEKLYPEDETHLGDLAYHHFRGREWEKAVGYAERAARQAEARYADDEALGYYRQALDALAHLPAAGPQRRFALLNRCLRAEERQGDYERMTATLAEMEDVARASGDDAILAGALLSRGHFLRMVGPIPEALTVLEECVRLNESIGRPDLLASALVDRAWVYTARLRDHEALADVQRALTIYREGDFTPGVERQVQHAVALRSVGDVYIRLGRFQAALDALDESLALLRALPDARLDLVALTKLELGWVLKAIGGTQRSLKVLAEALETVREIDLRGVMVEAPLLATIIRMEVGEGSLDEAREAVHGLEHAGRWQSRPDVKSQRAGLLAWHELMTGRLDLALSDAQLSIAQCIQTGDLHLALLATPMLTFIHLALGQVEAALDVSARALDTLGERESFAAAPLAFARYQALVAAGRLDEARPYLEQAYRILTARLESLRDPDLCREAYDFPFHAQIITTWEEAQGA